MNTSGISALLPADITGPNGDKITWLINSVLVGWLTSTTRQCFASWKLKAQLATTGLHLLTGKAEPPLPCETVTIQADATFKARAFDDKRGLVFLTNPSGKKATCNHVQTYSVSLSRPETPQSLYSQCCFFKTALRVKLQAFWPSNGRSYKVLNLGTFSLEEIIDLYD